MKKQVLLLLLLFWCSIMTFGQTGSNLNFDGTDDSVSLPTQITGALSVSTEFTIEYWFKGGNLQSGVRIQNGNDYIVAGWGITNPPSFIVSTDGGTTGVSCGSAATINDNTWHHLAFVWKKNTTFATYLDGVLQNSRTAANVNLPQIFNINGYLGSFAGTSEFLSGNLDDVRIWLVARTATEIANSRNCELKGNEPNLLAYYKFNHGIAAGNNTALTTTLDSSPNNLPGTLTNFTRNGATSNFVASPPISTPDVPTAIAQTPCTGATVASLIPAPSSTIKWYNVATGGAALANATALASGSYYVSATNASGCESARTTVSITVTANAPNAPAANTPQAYVGTNTIASLVANGSTLKWYAAATGGSQLANTTALANGTTYFVSQTTGCGESNRTAVLVRKISEATQTICGPATVTNLIVTPSSGATANWFTASSGGSALANNTTVSNSTLYVEQTVPTSTTTLGSGFSFPSGIAVESDGKILVTDTNANRIKRMNADGSNIVIIGSGFSFPTSVAVQPDGKILIADYGNNAIKRMDADGTNIVTLGSGFSGPSGIAVQTDGKILIADTGNSAIKRMDANGLNIVTLGSGFSFPTGVAVQSDGKILVVDWGNYEVKRMDVNGGNIESFGSGFVAPQRIAVQSDGMVLVTDSYNGTFNTVINAVKRMNANGTGIQILASGLNNPQGIAIQADGKILIADKDNSAIKRINESFTSTRFGVAVTVNSTLAPTASAQSFCNLGTVANLVATGTAVKWYAALTGGVALASTTALVTGNYFASQTINSCESASRTSVAVTLSNPAAPLAVGATLCNGATVTSLSATGTGIKWYAASTGGVALASTTALVTGNYFASQTINGCESASRTSILVSIITTASPTVTSPVSLNLNGASTSLTATGSGLLWYSVATGGSGTATAPTPSTSNVGATSYWVSQTLNSCESARVQIVVNVNSTVPATHLHFDGSNDGVSLPVNIGNSLSNGTEMTIEYWFKGTVMQSAVRIQGSGGNYIVAGWDAAFPKCIISTDGGTSGVLCGSPNTINDNTWHHLAFVWKKNVTFSTYLDGVLQNSRGTANVNLPTFSGVTTFLGKYDGGSEFLNGNLDDVRIWNVALSAEDIARRRSCELAGNEAGLLAYYKFNQGFDASANASVSSLTDATANAYTGSLSGFAYAGATSNWLAGSPVASGVTIPVAPTATSQNFCGTTTVANFVPAPSATIKWYNVAIGGTALSNPDVAAAGTYYVAALNANGCESTRTTVAVTINTTTAPTAVAQSFCNLSTVADLVTTSGTIIKWYAAATGGVALASTTALVSGNYFASQTINGCESASRTSVAVTISTAAAPTAVAQSFCNLGTVADLVTTSGTNITWYAGASGGVALASTTALVSGNYFASQTIGTCESASRTSVAVTINTTLAPTANAQAFCNLGTVADLVTTSGTNIKWYAAATGGTALLSTDILTSTNYFASQTIGTCESASRTSVAVTINNTPNPTASNQNFTNGTVANLVAIGDNLKWYAAAIGGTALLSVDVLTTASYFVSQTIGTCESDRVQINVTVNSTVPATHLNFDGTDDGVSLPVNIGNSLSNGTEMTIEYWYKGTALQSAVRIQDTSGNFIVAGWGASAPQFIISSDGGTGGVNCGPESTINNNTWHHLAFVWKKNVTFATYLDGVLQNSRVASNANLPVFLGVPTFLGTYDNTSEWLNGNLDDVRIWNVARSFDQINGSKNCELLGNEPGLLAYYKFNQGFDSINNSSVSSLTDATANAYNGSLSGFAYDGATSNWLAGSPIASDITIPVAPTAVAQTFCGGQSANILVPAMSSTIKWYNATTSSALVSTSVLTSGTYYVVAVNANGCESERTSISLTNLSATVPTTTAVINYSLNYVASPLVATGTNLKWYTTATGGTASTTAPTPNTSVFGVTSYWVSQTLSSCESDRALITVNVASFTAIPDPNFEQALITLGYDTAPIDGRVITSNISGVTILNLNSKNISLLVGIQDFVGLKQLYCANNQLSTLNISSLVNLEFFTCDSNNLTSLNLNGLNKLIFVSCTQNNLTSLSINGNTLLKEINCRNNNMTSLTLSNLPAFIVLICDTNSLSSLDLSGVPSLETLYCRYNTISSIGLTNVNLKTLYCSGNSSISLSNLSSQTNLQTLDATDCNLTALNVSALTNLKYLNCYTNGITQLSVTGLVNLEELYVGENNLSKLDLTGLTALTSFDCLTNPNLTCVRVNNPTAANSNPNFYKDATTTFNTFCPDPGYTAIPDPNFEQALIDLGYDTAPIDGQVLTATVAAITSLNVNAKSISSLTGIQAFVALTSLTCISNLMTSLDISANIALTNLNATSNTNLVCIQVASVTVAQNNANWFKDAIASYNLDCRPKTLIPDANFEQVLINLGYDTVLDGKVLTSNINTITSLTLNYEDNNENIVGYGISSLIGIQDFTGLSTLNCGRNLIQNLNLSSNVALTTLVCNDNQLENIDLSTNVALTTLICNRNKLESLDLTNNVNLSNVNTQNNPLLECIKVAPSMLTNAENNWNYSQATNISTSCPCSVSTTWSNGSWSNGAPTASIKAIISSNYTLAANLETCRLKITGNAMVTVPSGLDVTVGGSVIVASTANLTFENNANLMQTTFSNNSGNVNIKRNTSMQRLAYTMWSSPVAEQNALAFSPLTVASRFYTYAEPTNTFVELTTPSTTNFVVSQGYAVRAPNTFADAPNPATPFTGTFTGAPNNGNYTFSGSKVADGYNLIGNPYPSSLDVPAFFAANTNVDALYFWDNSNLGVSGNRYATKSLGGSVVSALSPSKAPTDFIGVGQGFYVRITSATNTNVVFTNAMRSSENTPVFFRNATSNKSLFKLNLLSATNNFNQIAVGYMNGATNGVDNQIDAVPFGQSPTMVSSLINNVDYVIQGRSLPFANTDVVPLGFKTDVAGNYSFNSEAFEGVFANNQNIFLKDNLTGTTHNIKQSPYSFTTNVGTFNNRFEIVYVNGVLGIENPNFNDNNVFVFVKNNNININSGNINMKNIQVYDIRGRLVFDKKEVNATQFEIENLKVEQSVLIVKITSEDGSIVTKKIVY